MTPRGSRALRSFAVLACLVAASSACRPALDSQPIDVSLAIGDANPSPGVAAPIRVTGLGRDELRALTDKNLSTEQWQSLFRVTVVGLDGPAIAGTYQVTSDALLFKPAFRWDPGRRYKVSFDPAQLPSRRAQLLIEKTIALAPAIAAAPASVAGLWPAASRWPENLLRFYIHFSAPMSATNPPGRVSVVDEDGEEIEGALLPFEADLWNADRTRYTVFFDPGRVKRGILPNRERGRPLVNGRRYAIVVDGDWRDGHGQPLAAPFRHEFLAGPEQAQAIDPSRWRLAPPAAATRQPLTVDFPWPLDRAILRRALGVSRAGAGAFLEGEMEVERDDTRWNFIPNRAWPAGAYELVAFTVLEDPSGNAIGRPFEIDMFRKPAADTPTVRTRFEIR
jgi:hypothetical protein